MQEKISGKFLSLFSRKELKRRKFIVKMMTWLGMGIAYKAFALIPGKGFTGSAPSPSKVITVSHPDPTDKTGGKDNVNLREDVLTRMVNEGIKAFTGKQDLKEAWEQIIPDPRKKVAIKINCQVEGIYTKEKVVKPIVHGLILRGIQPDNIIIYDKTDNAFRYAGFKKYLGKGVKIGTVSDFGGYSRFFFEGLANLLIGGYHSSLLNFLSQLSEVSRQGILGPLISGLLSVQKKKYNCDYIINIPVLKALDVCSGVTLSMKNHYGSIANPGSHHEDVMTFLPYLNNLPLIKNKTRLIILDAIFCGYKWQNSRSQKFVSVTNRIIISNDPVAIDYLGWQLIEKERERNNLPPLPIKPQFIENAAKLGLGHNNPELFHHLEINLPE